MTSSMATDVADALRTFYQDVLGGHEAWSTRGGDAGESLWFLVGSTLIEARVGDDAPTSTVLTVDAPEQVAERCWDAGFVVHVRDDAGGALLSVVDRLGRRIELSARGSAARARMASSA